MFKRRKQLFFISNIIGIWFIKVAEYFIIHDFNYTWNEAYDSLKSRGRKIEFTIFLSKKKNNSFAERDSPVKIECQMRKYSRGAETSAKVDKTFDL